MFHYRGCSDEFYCCVGGGGVEDDEGSPFTTAFGSLECRDDEVGGNVGFSSDFCGNSSNRFVQPVPTSVGSAEEEEALADALKGCSGCETWYPLSFSIQPFGIGAFFLLFDFLKVEVEDLGFLAALFDGLC